MPSAHLARIEVSAGYFLSALSSGSLTPRTISIYEIFQNVTLMCVRALGAVERWNGAKEVSTEFPYK